MSSSRMDPGRTAGTDVEETGTPVGGQDAQVGGAQEHGVGRDPQVGEATSTESESPVRESGAVQEDRVRERVDLDDREDREDDRRDRDGDRRDADDRDGDPREQESDEDRRRREEEFAREHDPANHDVAAGEEFRQRGDVIVDGDRAKAVDGEGNYVDAGDAAGLADGTATPAASDQDDKG